MDITGFGHDEHLDFLDFAAKNVAKARTELAEAEREQRIYAVMAVRGGLGKTIVAARLGISRPTLDAWITKVQETPEDADRIEWHEYLVRRESDLATAVHRR